MLHCQSMSVWQANIISHELTLRCLFYQEDVSSTGTHPRVHNPHHHQHGTMVEHNTHPAASLPIMPARVHAQLMSIICSIVLVKHTNTHKTSLTFDGPNICLYTAGHASPYDGVCDCMVALNCLRFVNHSG
jgi:hypothetical protein